VKMSIREDGRKQVQLLVERFRDNYGEYTNTNSSYNETQLRIDFLNPFLQALGWDVSNERHVPQHLREVIHEDRVSIETDDESGFVSKKPDYAFRVGVERKFFLEAKKPSVAVAIDSRPAFQTRRYGWNARMAVSILTNFDKLVIYDCRTRPNPTDDAHVARVKVYDYTEYVAEFDAIYDQFSREAVYSGLFDKTFAVDELRSGMEPFDKYFLRQIERWRRGLAEDIVKNNVELKQTQINFLVQRLINRIIFLRVCEDRELEKYQELKDTKTYQELKKLFMQADKRYNSGLFDFVEDHLSLHVEIGGDVLIQIFKELYFPESPYAFGVVETDVLSEIYELFLGKEIELGSDGSIKIVTKPEVVESNGVIATPRYIVDAIVQKALALLCLDKSPNELMALRIADIACGSGTFLLSAYQYLLNYHLEWYLKDGVEKHSDKVYESVGETWYLTLREKQRIMLNNIYGVDLDAQAVEVTQFSLMLKVLENESVASIEALAKHKIRGLPKLIRNIQWGNSLVDNSYFDYDETIVTNSQRFSEINPFDWTVAFPEIMSNGGFDVIVGNPPYVRTQNMVHYSPNEVNYYQSSISPYNTAKSDNFDKYALFIERSLHLLKSEGILAYIVPHKFFAIKSGSTLRKLISEQNYLSELVYFGVQQIFGTQTTTYTCILLLRKQVSEQVIVEHVTNLDAWRNRNGGKVEILSANEFTEKPWLLISPEIRTFFQRLETQNTTTLGAVSDIFVGLQTSNDKIYIIRPNSETESTVVFTDAQGVWQTIEKAILQPCFYKATLAAFSSPRPNAYIIFPYVVEGEVARLYSEEEMVRSFPACWSYLNAYKDQLMKRNIHNYDDKKWYQYGRSQSLTKFNGEPKLIWSTLGREARYVYDEKNILFTGGGNGPYYALRQKGRDVQYLYYLQAILSHPIFEAMIQVRTSKFRGDYSSHGKQFIQTVPIREIDLRLSRDQMRYEKIVMLVQQLIAVTDNLKSAPLPTNRAILNRQGEALKKQIDQIIEELYEINSSELQLMKSLNLTTPSEE